MRILITGATGLLGKNLTTTLQKLNHTVSAVERSQWDALNSSVFPLQLLENVDAVIHLAGYPIADKRWTTAIKKKILDSRVRGTQQIVSALKQKPVSVFICASAVGFYGDRGDESLNENSFAGNDFLADVVQQWENQAQVDGIRTVLLRSGMVLAREGGALAKMPPVVIGSGKSYMSWIHIEDWVNLVVQTLSDERYRGVFNLVAPQPVTQSVFTKALADAKKIPLVLWSPKFALKLGLGQMSEMILASQKVLPQRALDLGFQFKFPNIQQALTDIYQDEDYLTQDFRSAHVVKLPLEKVFHFFSDAKNLEKLTPPFLNFKIEKMSTAQIQKGTLIDYKLKIHGVPVGWQTEIIHWEPQNKFIDFQNKGPYSLWHHTHTFTSLAEGTLIEDRIKYKVPGHILGLLFAGGFIRKDISNIFSFREKIIKQELS